MIITIDGYIATGKSSVAKKLAEAIGFIFFDTGAMYRTLTYGLLKHHINFHNEEDLKKFLDSFDMDVKIYRRERLYFYEDEDVTDKIRSREVTEAVSEISANKAVRDKLILLQRELSVGVNAVFEGRDMGTVVFPNAELKIFLIGRNEIRAKRRFDEIVQKYPEQAKNLTLEQCLEDINRRDHYDSTRENSPLVQPKDAHVIDTSDLSLDDVVNKILESHASLT